MAEERSRQEEIRRGAYAIYLEGQGHPGGELDDWLRTQTT